jgi:hypothetical protein
MISANLEVSWEMSAEVVHPKSMPKRAKPQDEGLDLITVSYNLPAIWSICSAISPGSDPIG